MLRTVVAILFLFFPQAVPPDAAAVKALATQLVAAKSDAERDALLAIHKPLVTPELGRSLEAQADSLKVQGEYPAAMAAYAYLEKMSRASGDRAGVAGALRGIGAVNYYQGNYEAAVTYLEQALAIRKELDDKPGIAYVLGALGAVYYSQANYPVAMQYSQDSLDLRAAIGDRTGAHAVLNNVALIYMRQGDYDLALETHSKALALEQEINDTAGMLTTFNNIANIYFDLGNYRLALDYYERVLEGHRQSSEPDKVGLANALHNIGGVHLSQRSPRVALEYLSQALKLRQEMDDKAGISESYDYLGNAADQLGNHSEALRYEFQSLDIRKQLKDISGIGVTLDYIGDTYHQTGDDSKALEYFQAALAQFQTAGNKAWVSMVLTQIASLSLNRGDYSGAASYARRALALAGPMGYEDTLWRAHTAAGAAARGLGDLDGASAHYQQAIDVIESVRSQVSGGEEERARFFEDKVRPYEAMVELLIGQGKTREALTFAERSRGRVLLDVLRSGHQSVTKALTSAEREEEHRLNVEIATLNAQVARERERTQPANTRLLTLETAREKARRNLEAFQTRLHTAHPELAIERGELPALDIRSAEELLADDRSALLEYVVAGKRTFLFVLRKSGAPAEVHLTVHTIPAGDHAVIQEVQRLRSKLEARAMDFREPASRLYNLLLAPAKAELAGVTNIVILPDSGLWELPFQALVTPRKRYLLEEAAISYAPSITVLKQMMAARRRTSGEFSGTLLAFGNPLMSDAAKAAPVPGRRRAGVAALPEAEREVRLLGQLYGSGQSKVYVGAEARENRFKEEAGRYRILHIATHGFLDDRSPMYSYVRMAQSREAGEDGLLEAREIANLNLRADLAVLSACETARGRVGAGEGVIGLAWALFVAGSPASVVSQWKVESASTSELMLAFHKRYREKLLHPAAQMTTANALRLAALDVMRAGRYSHPFYWAAFVVLGDGT